MITPRAKGTPVPEDLMRRYPKIRLGEKVGYLKVISFVGMVDRYFSASCECICGRIAIFPLSHLNRGSRKSCGCKWHDMQSDGKMTHGMSKSPTYSSWCKMHSRCKGGRWKKWYKDKGIKVCERWNSFENFLADMGERPKGLTLDRINNNGNYEPGNCRWATQEQQINNTDAVIIITAFGKTAPLSEWAKTAKIKRATIQWRVTHGWNHEEALTVEAKYYHG